MGSTSWDCCGDYVSDIELRVWLLPIFMTNLTHLAALILSLLQEHHKHSYKHNLKEQLSTDLQNTSTHSSHYISVRVHALHIHVFVCAEYMPVCIIVCICECICVLGIVHGIEHLSPKVRSKSLKVSQFTKITKTLCQAQLCWCSFALPKGCSSCLYRAYISINITLVGLFRMCLSLQRHCNMTLKYLSLTYVYHI